MDWDIVYDPNSGVYYFKRVIDLNNDGVDDNAGICEIEPGGGFGKGLKSVTKTIRGAGKANTPKSTISRDKSGNFLPHPNAQGAHTTLGTRTGRRGTYTQGATYDNQGNFKGVTDVTGHGRGHQSPHWHPAKGPNSIEHGPHPPTATYNRGIRSMIAKRYMQICIDTNNGTDGIGLINILKQILSLFVAKWALISDVDLVGKARQYLSTQGYDVQVIAVSNLLELLKQVDQIVWASIFLCVSEETAQTITGDEDFVSALGKSKILIRVIDATYYYVYGPVELLENSNISSMGEIKMGFAEELDFPE